MSQPSTGDEESITIGGEKFTPEEFAQLAGMPPMLLMEAIASVRMSRDPRAQTYSAEDLPPTKTGRRLQDEDIEDFAAEDEKPST